MTANRPSHRRAFRTALLFMTAAVTLCAQSVLAGEGERSFVVRAGRVITVAADQPFVIESGVIVVRDGRIVSVGADIETPPDLPLYDWPDATVMPGLIAASTSLAGEHTGDESVAAGYHAIDTYDAYANYADTLASGVTTVHLGPGEHRLVSGQGAIVKLGGPLTQRVLSDRADLTVNFGDAAYDPPKHLVYTIPSSSDVAIQPAMQQRPDSRLGQYLAFTEALAKSEPEAAANWQQTALRTVWREEKPLRVQAQRGADIAGAVAFLRRHGRRAYIVGAAEADLAVDALVAAKMPVVYRVAEPFRGDADDLGYDPDVVETDLHALRALGDVKLAIAGPLGEPTADLRLAAATALRAGLSTERVITAMTRAPAEILGISDRVGSLSPGMDADFIVLTGAPLATSTHVERVYIGGQLAFEAPETGALVVHAETIWLSERERLHDASVLIEGGKIVAVGPTVPHPPFARFIDAGKGSFLTPGFIDAYGHLGLDGDEGATGPALSLSKLTGVPDAPERRVASAGVTTVMLSPYSTSSQGSQVSAVKTGGASRDARVVRDTAGVTFSLDRADYAKVDSSLRKQLAAAKTYLEKWTKYEKELAEWKEKQAKGEAVEAESKTEDSEEVDKKPDPLTGTWDVTISGGPIPEPQTAVMQLRLTGNDIEGYLRIPGQPDEAKVVGTLDGTHVSATIEIDTGGLGGLKLEADIVDEDHLVGTIEVQGITIDVDALRTDKSDVEFKVVRHRKRGRGGRPLPPKVEESKEPLRAVLEGKIPIVVAVRTAPQVKAVMKVVEDFEVDVVLRGAAGAAAHVDALSEHNVGVIVSTPIARMVHERWYHLADDLARHGVSIAFQSDAEDAARALPRLGLHAVERGLSADAALAAFTTRAARMYHIGDRIGSIQPGRDGDLVIFSGHPFEAGSRIERVLINGEEVK